MLEDKDLLSIQEVRTKVDKAYAAWLKYRDFSQEQVDAIVVPVGVVAAILPTTNPTSTAIYKSLISLKAGNAIVISPHPRAYRCTCETASILYRAALEAGAPE